MKLNELHRVRFQFPRGKVYFSETFGDGWESRWTSSEWKKSDGTQGTWKSSAGKWFSDEKEDQGIQTAEARVSFLYYNRITHELNAIYIHIYGPVLRPATPPPWYGPGRSTGPGTWRAFTAPSLGYVPSMFALFPH